MPDVDTSANRDPSPTRDELLAIRDRMNARLDGDGRVRDYGRPIRIIRSANLLTVSWRSDERDFALRRRGYALHIGERGLCDTLAETGEHLGLERVGLVVGVEVQP